MHFLCRENNAIHNGEKLKLSADLLHLETNVLSGGHQPHNKSTSPQVKCASALAGLFLVFITSEVTRQINT